MIQQVIKREGQIEAYDASKISNAVRKAFNEFKPVENAILEKVVADTASKLNKEAVHIEEIQDAVEKTLMEKGYYEVAKAYILYREEQIGRASCRGRV